MCVQGSQREKQREYSFILENSVWGRKVGFVGGHRVLPTAQCLPWGNWGRHPERAPPRGKTRLLFCVLSISFTGWKTYSALIHTSQGVYRHSYRLIQNCSQAISCPSFCIFLLNYVSFYSCFKLECGSCLCRLVSLIFLFFFCNHRMTALNFNFLTWFGRALLFYSFFF